MTGNAFEQRMSELGARYRERSLGDAERLDALAQRLEGPEAGLDARNDLRSIAHRIAGTAGTFGFPVLTSFAAKLEDLAQQNVTNTDIATGSRALANQIRETMGTPE